MWFQMRQRVTSRHARLYRNAVLYLEVDDAPEITVLQRPEFKAEATKLIRTDGIEAVAVHLIKHPEAGAVIPASGGVRKIRIGQRAKESVAARGLSTCTL